MREGCGDVEPGEYATGVLSWTPYFSHVLNTCKNQSTLKDWFSLWGHHLNPKDPTELDWALAHTNLFVDAPDIFGNVGRGHGEWVQAIEDLAMVAKAIDASGIVFMSTVLGDNVAWYVNNDWYSVPDWWHEIGPDLEWSQAQYGQLRLRTARLSSIPLANMCSASSTVPDETVRKSSKVMKPWLDAVLERYLRVQERIGCAYTDSRSLYVVSQAELANIVRQSQYREF